ncbi:MAG TPA: pyrroline-5-carboxylate reductase [Burkholderiaceae bacterium]|nr:pyrroline-5-carboxylate reductase [Burkholderiaceae bacterium]
MPVSLSQLPNVAFVGGGNMAQALIGGLHARGVPSVRMFAVDPNDQARTHIAQQWNVNSAATIDARVTDARVVVLAVKPQSMREVCSLVQPFLHPQALVLSVAAGIRAVDLARWLNTSRIVRTMPNTPALVGAGMTGLAALPTVSEQEREIAQTLMSSVGDVMWVDDEAMLDAVTAVSGSGPGYVFLFIEALERAARELGFDAVDARRLATATFTGASTLAARSDESLTVLRERVTSKGGTTHAAISTMQSHNVPEHIVQGVLAAATRSQALGDEFGRAG